MKRPSSDTETERCQSGQDGFTEQKRKRTHNVFQTAPIQLFDCKFPYYRQPKEIGAFSQNSEREFSCDRSQLKKYIKPLNTASVSFDLKQGYTEFIKRDDSHKEYLDDLLKWISLNKDKFYMQNQSNTFSLNTDFICWRGLLTKLLCTPYENRDDWKFAAFKHEGTIYMCEFETEKKKQQKLEETEKQREMSYWGYKFEQYVTGGLEDKQVQTDHPVNNHEGFCSVVRTRLSSHSLVFGGEVDCCEIDDSHKAENVSYIELKTSRVIENKRQDLNFKRFKLLKWWAQSFLIGIPRIICGFRDDHGIVQYLKDISVKNIPKDCQIAENTWQASVCFNFLNNFLQYVKDAMVDADLSEMFVFEWAPRQDVKFSVHGTDSQYHFLPLWYVNGRTDPENFPSGESTPRYINK